MRYFLAVVQHGSIRAAAEALLINQSAISRQIQSLEEEYETPLFERHARGVRLTPAGELVFGAIREIGFTSDRARSEINALQGLKRGHIKMHVIESMIQHVIPSVIEKFHDQFPGVNFEVIMTGSDAVVTAVRNGECDFGITLCNHSHPGVTAMFSIDCRLTAIMRPDHPLASQRNLSVGNLVTWPVGVATRPTGTRQFFDDACRTRGVDIIPKIETNSVELLHQFALMEEAVVVTSDLMFAASIRSGKLLKRPLAETELNNGRFEVLVMTGRKPTVAAERFLMMLGRELERPVG
ncbi:LysR family transcriptional regulator [Devosia sp. ZB163]|uniref:LysR family transcriptional regulator n=1 Tax=Devosia sp. ZB163 TaxID=3025938 RepID=UPI002361F5A3|nr:LysR family transcriptional regulator [Devosia sp. ZB163]MDC9824227.1 LysR family transcriptional regulator [Devosia sp. ZB163]